MLAAKPGDDFVGAQRELGAELSSKLQKRAGEFAAIASDAQSSLASALTKAVDSVAPHATKKAA